MHNLQLLKEERDKIVKGLEEAYKKLVKFKILKNSPLIVSKNGEIIEIPPADIFPTTRYKRKKH